MEACAAVDCCRCTGNALQFSNHGTFAQSIHDELGSHSSTGHVVRCDGAIDVHTVNGTVNADDTHTLGHGGLHGACNSIRVHGVDNQHADARGNQSLNVSGLLCSIVTSIGNLDINAQAVCLVLGSLNQSDKEGVILGRHCQTDRAVAHDFHLFTGRISIVLSNESNLNGNALLNGLTVDELHRVLHCGSTQQSGLLCNGTAHTAGLDGLNGVIGSIEANHQHVLACAGNSFQSAQSHLVVSCEDRLNVTIALQNILHDTHALSTVEVCSLACNHVQLGICDLVETCAAVDCCRCAGNALQLSNHGTLAQSIHDVLGSHSGTCYVIGSNGAVDFNAINSTVNRNNSHTCSNGSLNSTGNSIRVHGVDNQHFDAGRHQSLNIGSLLCSIVTCVGNLQVDTQLICFSLCALYQGHKEGVVLSRNCQTNGAIHLVCGRSALFTVNDDAAGSQGQCHCDSQQ